MLPDTDAAGILFFGNYIKLAHHTYELFMVSIDYDLKYILDEADELILIVHTEADYKNSLWLNDDFWIELTVEKIGRTSFELQYNFYKEDELMAVVKTVHVAVSKESKKPVALTEKLKSGLT